MKGRHGMGGTSWDIEIHRDEAIEVSQDIIAAREGTARDGAAAAGDDHLWGWYGVIGGQECSPHIGGDGTGDMNAICVAG